MPENNFEKRVKEKMDPFSLVPSASTWEAVASRIQKQKKRRFFFWLIIAILLGGVAVSTYLFMPGKQAKNKTAFTKTDSTLNKTGQNQTVSPDKTVPAAATVGNTKTVDALKPASQGVDFKSVKEKAQVIKKSRQHTVNMQKDLTDNRSPDTAEIKIEPKIVTVYNTKSPGKSQDTVAAGVTPVNHNDLKSHELSTLAEQKTVENKPEKLVATPAASNSTQTMPSRWGLAFSVGNSAVIRKLEFFGGMKSLDNLAAQPPSNPLAATTFVSGPRASWSFSGTLFFRSRISSRLDLYSGLHYQYLSTRMHAGTRIDSNRLINNFYSPNLFVDRYYRPNGNTNNYTNKYHFIGGSFDLSWKILDRQHFKVRWNNGLTAAALIGSNMLHYDYASQVYYKDNNRLNKPQLFYTAAFEFPISKKLSLSPFGSLSLTKVFKSTDSLAYHYSNYGIQLRMQLGTKKK